MMPRYVIDTARIHHVHGRDTDFTHKIEVSDMVPYGYIVYFEVS